MLNGISWHLYLAGAGALLGGYYLAAGLWLYRQELQALLLRKQRAAGATSPEERGDEAPRYLSYEELEHVASQIRRGILEAGKEASKQDLLRRIKASLATSGGLRLPASRGAINHYIVQQAQEICGVVFSEEELEQEWETLPR
ncbi:hypothetical protein [Pontibacter liquoris]|uniref:hypothetical protein n=1 Tax=Pontibacter liquoris TaxID=2905677 RepID=UPI001FA7FE11|nr:hypothetical protein [Pontibacter liquoris]